MQAHAAPLDSVSSSLLMEDKVDILKYVYFDSNRLQILWKLTCSIRSPINGGAVGFGRQIGIIFVISSPKVPIYDLFFIYYTLFKLYFLEGSCFQPRLHKTRDWHFLFRASCFLCFMGHQKPSWFTLNRFGVSSFISPDNVLVHLRLCSVSRIRWLPRLGECWY